MRRIMDGSIVLLGVLVAFTSLACCPPIPKHTGEYPVPPEPIKTVEAPVYVPEPTPPPKPPVVEAPPPKPAPVPVVPPTIAKKIQDLADKYPGLFTIDRTTGLILFASDITFDSGSAVVKPQAKQALEKLATILADDEVKGRKLTVIGHTDSDRVAKAGTIDNLKKLGKSPDNMGLSEARAESVAAVLQNGGIEGRRMTAKARGSNEPIADNKTPEGKARNRRVEIYITPMEAAPKGNG